MSIKDSVIFCLKDVTVSTKDKQLFPIRRIFHFDADVIKASFEVLWIILSLLMKHLELHLQFFIFYLLYLLQEQDETESEGWKGSGENDRRNILILDSYLFYPQSTSVCKNTLTVYLTAATSKEYLLWYTFSMSLRPSLSSSERIWILKSNSSPRLIKALISCMQPACQNTSYGQLYRFNWLARWKNRYGTRFASWSNISKSNFI